jgi:hypothetical protein
VQVFRADLQPLQLPGPQVLHQHVCAGHQFQQCRAVLFQVQFDRQLVAAVDAEPDGVPFLRRAPAAEGIAAGRFDLDHLGAEIGENPRAERRGDIMADLQDLQPQKGGSTHRHYLR